MNKYSTPKILLCADSAITIEFGNAIAPEINADVRALTQTIQSQAPDYIVSLIPTYRSLTLIYDPLLKTFDEVKGDVSSWLKQIKHSGHTPNKIVEIPVCYDASLAPDLAEVASHNQLSVEDVIQLHAEREYPVYMLGFSPGFPYLGGMDERIATPRKKTPRTKIEAGSVGIADKQTGIYSVDSPGGWQIIGRTPLKLYDKDNNPPCLLSQGDTIKFKPISLDAYHALSDNRMRPQTQPDTQRAHIRVQSAGMTSIQDAGRFGYEAYGITQGGAMDNFACRIANILVGNSKDDAVLEMTMFAPTLAFEAACSIAITGADSQPMLNGAPIAMWRTQRVQKGDVVSFKGVKNGMRSYLAVSGGILSPKALGSRATDVKALLGGLDGKMLKAGDVLPIANEQIFTPMLHMDAAFIPDNAHHHTIRVVLGPQDDYFNQDAIDTFLSETYSIDEKSNRMGYRLNGKAVSPIDSSDIISDGIVFGSVQITNSGQPVIMMADHQTTGGYAKIATVITADLPKLAQARIGDKLRFECVSIKKAQRIYREYAERLNYIQNCIMCSTNCRHFDVLVNGKHYDVTIEI